MNSADPPQNDPPRKDARDSADVGAELLARLLGQLEPERESEIDALLADSDELRAEYVRLETEVSAWRASPGSRLEPRAETLETLRGLIEDEAAERRADAAVAASPLPVALGEDLVALALDQLEGEPRATAQRAIDDDPECAAEVAAVRRLVAATRQSFSLTPHAQTENRLLRLFARETLQPLPADRLSDVPAPRSRRRRGPRLWHVLLPTAIAAAVLLVVTVMPGSEGQARIHEGRAICWIGADEAVNGERQWLDSDSGAFDFVPGQVLEAGHEPVRVRVACQRSTRAPHNVLRPGTAEFALQPGARLERIDYGHFELLAGRMEIRARELNDDLEISSGDLYASVRGTRFRLTAVEGRLVAAVTKGSVELGRRGEAPDSLVLQAGEQGLVDAERLLRRAADERPDGDAFLAPRASLAPPGSTVRRGETVRLEARLAAGEGGAVRIAVFDDSVPLFLIRLKGPDGREYEVKVQRSMIVDEPPGAESAGGMWRLDTGRPYWIRLDVPTTEATGRAWEPGTWEARLRYMSYKAHSSGSEWLGVVESEPVTFEVTE